MLYWYGQAVSLPMYCIRTAMKYHFKADNCLCACVMVPVICLSSANLTDITTPIAWTSYSYPLYSFGVSYNSSKGIAFVPFCIMATSCICTLLQSISKNNWKI